MNSVEQASRDMLIALVIDAARGDGDIPNLEDLRQRYHIKVSDQLLGASVEPWLQANWLIDARTKDSASVRLKLDRFGAALSKVLDYLDATQFEISWKKEEILTDANAGQDIPCPSGWKLLYFEKPRMAIETPPPNHQPIQIHNVFAPTNTQAVNIPASNDGASVRVGWWSLVFATIVGITAIVVSLWIGGKL